MRAADAGLSGYSTDLNEGNVLSGLSPLPFVSPSLGLGPQMHPRLPQPTSLASSPGYTAQLYSSPAVHAALPYQQQQQQQQHRYAHPAGVHKHSSSSAKPSLSTSPQGDGDAYNPDAKNDSQAGFFEAQHAQHSAQGYNPAALDSSQAGLFIAQHAQRRAEAQTYLEEQTMFPRRTSAPNRGTDGGLRADVGACAGLHHDSGVTKTVDPVLALQSNLTAMDAAISETGAAVVPVQAAVTLPVTAASSSQIKQGADTKPAVFLPVQAPVVSQLLQPARSQVTDVQPASCNSLDAPAQEQVPVGLPASSFLPSALQQPVSMAPISVAPDLPQQAASLLPRNLAPIGPPAIRAMTCHGPGVLLQLAAPALMPLPPKLESVPYPIAASHLASTAAAAPLPMTAAAQAEATSSGMLVTQDVVGVQSDLTSKPDALPEALQLGNSKLHMAEATQQGFHPVDQSSQQAGLSTGQQVSVSAASTVMLDEARAASTARQAALAVLNDTVQSAPAFIQAEARHSLPDQPFGPAQSSLATAVATNCQQPPSADLPPPTAVGASRQLFSMATMPPVTAVPLALAARPQTIAAMASMGQAQSLMAMTGPLPATSQGQEADSPVGGRPSQSETAVTVGRGSGIVTVPQDLHAAHLVHVLQAHKVSQQLADPQSQEDELELRQRTWESLSAGTSLPRIPEPSAAEAPVAGEYQQNNMP